MHLIPLLTAVLVTVAPLAKAQAALGGGAPAPTTTEPPEQYPVKTTVWENGTPIVYIQTFASVPQQGPVPITTGAIGLGTISGTVGAVRTGAADYANAGMREKEFPESFLVGIVGALVGVWVLV